MLCMPPSFIADYLDDGRGASEMTIDDHAQVSEELGYIAGPWTCQPEPTARVEMASEYNEVLVWKVEERKEGRYNVVKKSLETPEGLLWLQDRYPLEDMEHIHLVLPRHDKKIVTTDQEAKAYGWYMRTCAETLLENSEKFKAGIISRYKQENERVADRCVPVFHLWMPLTQVLFVNLEQDDGLYFMADHSKMLRELMDLVMETDRMCVDAAVAAKFQAVQTAIWGYEIYSPRVHDEHVYEYAKEVCERTKEAGSMFWIHCCGWLKDVIENGFYQKIKPNILECLNYPPCGDVVDWRHSRKLLGDDIITKGNLEDCVLLNGPISEIQRKTKELLDEQAGFRQLFSSSNCILPLTPVENVRAMMDVVHNYQG